MRRLFLSVEGAATKSYEIGKRCQAFLKAYFKIEITF
jgi:hypothetical protein